MDSFPFTRTKERQGEAEIIVTLKEAVVSCEGHSPKHGSMLRDKLTVKGA
jgi:hypothetical protein